MSTGPEAAAVLAALREEVATLRAELARQQREQRISEDEERQRRAALLAMLEDLQATQSQIERARREWNEAFDAVSDPIFVHDRELRIVRANQAYARAAGLELRELVGRPYWQVFPKRDGPLSGCVGHLERVDVEGAEACEEVALESGAIYLSRAYAIAGEQGEYHHSIHILEDVSAQRRAERERAAAQDRRQRQMLAADRASSSAAMLAGDIEHYARELTELAAAAFGVERANVWLFNEAETELRCIDLYEATPARHSAGAVLSQQQFAAEFEVLKRVRYVDADVAVSDPRTAGYAESYLLPLRITAMLDAVIQLSGRHLGLLCLEHVDQAHHWEPDEISFACQLADKFGLAFIHRGRLESLAALVKSNRALKARSASNAALVKAESEAGLYQDMCRVIVETAGYRLAWVGRVEHDAAQSVRPAASAGGDAGYLQALDITWADRERGQGPTGRAVRSGEPELVRDIPGDPRYAPWRGQATQAGYQAALALPLKDAEGAVFAVLNIYAAEVEAFGPEELALLRELAQDMAYGVRTLRLRVEHARLLAVELASGKRLRTALGDAIGAIAMTVEKRDPYTAGHQLRVAELSVAIGQELGFDSDRLIGLRLGASIHDIGKISVPAEILNRPRRLSALEFELVQSHPQVGYDIIKDVHFPWPLGQMILQHHERLDGSGYPQGLKGEDIILEARVLAVADVVEAMCSHRPYRAALALEAALHEIREHRGSRYDPAVVDACTRLFNEQRFAFVD